MSPLQCDFYLPVILNDPDFILKNKTGNNMYSNALKQYRMYRIATSDELVEQEDLEIAISGYSTLAETERIAILKSRVGQGLFRNRLLKKYNSTCIISGICTKRLLIASHIKPWAVSNNEERLSEENGLLLNPTYDKLFDCGLISFYDNGKLLISSQISTEDVIRLQFNSNTEYDIKTSIKLKQNLEYHRDIIFVK